MVWDCDVDLDPSQLTLHTVVTSLTTFSCSTRTTRNPARKFICKSFGPDRVRSRVILSLVCTLHYLDPPAPPLYSSLRPATRNSVVGSRCRAIALCSCVISFQALRLRRIPLGVAVYCGDGFATYPLCAIRPSSCPLPSDPSLDVVIEPDLIFRHSSALRFSRPDCSTEYGPVRVPLQGSRRNGTGPTARRVS